MGIGSCVKKRHHAHTGREIKCEGHIEWVGPNFNADTMKYIGTCKVCHEVYVEWSMVDYVRTCDEQGKVVDGEPLSG